MSEVRGRLSLCLLGFVNDVAGAFEDCPKRQRLASNTSALGETRTAICRALANASGTPAPQIRPDA